MHFPACYINGGTKRMFGYCFLPLMALIEIPARPTVEQPLSGDAPSGPMVYPGEESTHSERCPPKLASLRAWETGMFPSPCSIAQGLYPWESFHNSLSAIHKQPPPNAHKHTLSLLPSATHLHFYISHTILYYIDISHRLCGFFTLAVRSRTVRVRCTVCWSDCLSHLSLSV